MSLQSIDSTVLACNPRQIKHGTLLSIFDKGVLLVGESGVGKSSAALHLIEKGHKLICDDAPELIRVQANKIIGSCPSNIAGLLEVRGLSIWHIPTLFGSLSVQQHKNLDLVIRLIKPNIMTKTSDNQLKPQYGSFNVFNVLLPEFILTIESRHLVALQIENIVQIWISEEDQQCDY